MALEVDGVDGKWVARDSKLMGHTYPKSRTSLGLGQTWIWISAVMVYKQFCLWILME